MPSIVELLFLHQQNTHPRTVGTNSGLHKLFHPFVGRWGRKWLRASWGWGILALEAHQRREKILAPIVPPQEKPATGDLPAQRRTAWPSAAALIPTAGNPAQAARPREEWG